MMPGQLARLVNEVYADGLPVVAVSPHLDDAVLSCGALLEYLARRCPVTVVTVFTAASPRPWPLPARRQMRAIGEHDAERFYRRRQAEDSMVLAEMGAAWVHLGFVDALFRRVGQGPGLLPGRPRRPAYPTFRFDAARGRIAPADARLAGEIIDATGEVARTADARLLLAPLGVGRHVDHLITRAAVRDLGPRAVYYSDFPYSETAAPDAGFIRRHCLVPHPWLAGRAENARRIAGYRSQIGGLFPGGVIPTRPEIYWVAASDSATAA
jgi:LmbE family N-acetylglucosaminyl deacetylase